MFLLKESQFKHEVGFNINNHSSDSTLTEPSLILSYRPESKANPIQSRGEGPGLFPPRGKIEMGALALPAHKGLRDDLRIALLDKIMSTDYPLPRRMGSSQTLTRRLAAPVDRIGAA